MCSYLLSNVKFVVNTIVYSVDSLRNSIGFGTVDFMKYAVVTIVTIEIIDTACVQACVCMRSTDPSLITLT